MYRSISEEGRAPEAASAPTLTSHAEQQAPADTNGDVELEQDDDDDDEDDDDDDEDVNFLCILLNSIHCHMHSF